jgi:hypothetical protein
MSGATDPRFENFWTSISQLTLRFAARHLKVPVRELAAEVLAREERSQKLESILTRLPSYRAENLEADIAELAHAEVTEDDPLSARRVPEDIHGVGAAFGRRLERRPL